MHDSADKLGISELDNLPLNCVRNVDRFVHCAFANGYAKVNVQRRTFNFLYPRHVLQSAVFAVAACVAVCLSVCPSHAGIVSKRLNLS